MIRNFFSTSTKKVAKYIVKNKKYQLNPEWEGYLKWM